MAYQSPISTYTTTIATNIGEEFDKLVITEIAKVGVAVDKDELVKALEYDRDQYEKGYLDGRRYKPPIITNADRIRAMSDGELAGWLERIRLCCSTDLCGRICPFAEICYSSAEAPKETIDWLKQEAE